MNRPEPALALLASLALIHGGCGEECERPNDIDETPDCAEGWLLDGDQCVPEACGTGTWGELPVDATTIHVDIEADEGGDGSTEAPLRSIQAALDLWAQRGEGLVAVAAGSYPEALVLGSDHADLKLAGRCRELVTLDASVAGAQSVGIDIDGRFAQMELSSLSVVGAGSVGVKVRSGEVRLAGVAVRDGLHHGVTANQGNELAPAILGLEGCEIADNVSVGVAAWDTGTEITLVDTVIRDTRPDEDGNYGQGIQLADGATLRAQGCELIGNTAYGALVLDTGSELTLVNTVVRDTLLNAAGERGYGVRIIDGAALATEGCQLAGNSSAGISAFDDGTEVSLMDTVILQTQPNGTGDGGYGIDAGEGARVELEDCELVGNTGSGISAYHTGTLIALGDSSIAGTLAGPSLGLGMGAYVSAGATLQAERCLLADNSGVGLLAHGTGSEVDLVDTVIRDTQPTNDGAFGYGIEVLDGARLQAQGCELEGNTGAGVHVYEAGTRLNLWRTTIQGTLPDPFGRYGSGIEAGEGAEIEIDGCRLEANTGVGVLVSDQGTFTRISDSTITGMVLGFGDESATAHGVVAQYQSTVLASELVIEDNEGLGLYACENSLIECFDCELLDNRFAGAAAVGGGALIIRGSTISGTLEGANLGGGVGIYAAVQGDWSPPYLLIEDSVLSDNLAAGAWLAGDGIYWFDSVTVSGSIGIPHGVTTRCGDGVYARGTTDWDGSTGLYIGDSTLSDNEGAGLFLDDAWARYRRNSWSGNGWDVLIQKEACLSPGGDWSSVPDAEICPAWDRPACELSYSWTLEVADIDPMLPPPPAALPMSAAALRESW